jgi:hypothetical protein
VKSILKISGPGALFEGKDFTTRSISSPLKGLTKELRSTAIGMMDSKLKMNCSEFRDTQPVFKSFPNHVSLMLMIKNRNLSISLQTSYQISSELYGGICMKNLVLASPRVTHLIWPLSSSIFSVVSKGSAICLVESV